MGLDVTLKMSAQILRSGRRLRGDGRSGVSHRALSPARITEATLIMVAFQNEYAGGVLALAGARDAIAAGRHLLAAARRAKAPVVHIAHCGEPGEKFDPKGWGGQFIPGFEPREGEALVNAPDHCPLPADGLPEALDEAGASAVIVAGFLTDICVAITAHTARRLGYRVTVDAAACATRGVPGLLKFGIDAATVQTAALADLATQNIAIANI